MGWFIPLLLAAQVGAPQLELEYRATKNQPAHYLVTIRAVDEKGRYVPGAEVTCDGYWAYLQELEPDATSPAPLYRTPWFKGDMLGGVTFNMGLDTEFPFTCYARKDTRKGSFEISELPSTRATVKIEIR